FSERLVYPWERDSFTKKSPLGKIPFIETEEGGLSESQAILEYLEECFPAIPLYPKARFARAKCRELIQHLELNAEWVARRLYKECFFGGRVSQETKDEARERLVKGLQAVSKLTQFAPFACGPEFTAADCVAFVHFTMIRKATLAIYGEDFVEQLIPEVAAYMIRMDARPHFRTIMADRDVALEIFGRTGVAYEG
ncbi:MAG: glutathione S-transferase C-terminal domain-containing protein, partial [Hyphomicrobiales bacterium]|nr:glutathione S-transferase C-terminal domain-containing protein [Hyphomicrobiales bacterium]